MAYRFFILFLILIFPFCAGAVPFFTELLPNPAGDDTLGEYIDIRNTGCTQLDIGGYEVRDLQKGYIFPIQTYIESKVTLRLVYSMSKIALNNSGLETITLKNASGTIIDTYSYNGTQRDNAILSLPLIDETCQMPPPPEPPIPPTQTGSIVIPIENSGTTVPEDPPITSSGEILPTTPEVIEASGSLGDISSGGVIVPDIPIVPEPPPIVSGEITLSGSLESSGSLSQTGTIPHTVQTGASEVEPVVPDIPESSGSLSGNSTGNLSLPEDSVANSGAEIPITPYTETGPLIPSQMYYDDSDENNRIDTLEIVYPYSLTGNVNTGAMFLFSRSGGLAQTKIDTQTGYIVSGYLSGNTLLLTILEGDIEKTELHITNTTTSDLRLKSSSDLGFRSIGGQIPANFLLTSSFGNYEKVSRQSHRDKSLPLAFSGITTSTGGVDSATGAIFSGTTLISFPSIIPTLQSPSNAIFSSGTFLCIDANCRINITLAPIFSSGYSMSDFACYFSTGGEMEQDTDCNPNTYYYSSSGILSIELVSKIQPEEKIRENFLVIFTLTSSQGLSVVGPPSLDKNPPLIILEHDGKWKSYYNQISDTELECYSFTCAINLTAERSYDPEGGKVRFMWMYDMGELSEKKDPGERKFSLGDHTIWLRVIDESGNMSEIFYRISVLGATEKELLTKEKKSHKQEKSASGERQKSKKKSKKKMKKLIFFEPPQIVLQSKDSKTKQYLEGKCRTTTKTCSFNFALSGAQDHIVYTWRYSHGDEVISKNPRSISLDEGRHEVILTASYEGTSPLWSKVFDLRVERIKKPKKKSVKKLSISKNPKNQPLEIVQAGFSFPVEDTKIPIELIYLIGGMGVAYLLRVKFLR